MKKTKSKKSLKKKGRVRYRTKLDYLFFLLIIASITLILTYVANLEIPFPFRQKSITMSFLNINTTFNIYKVHLPRNSLQSDINLDIGLVIKEVGTYNSKETTIYLDLGTHRILADQEITFINKSSNLILNASKKYIAYLRVNRTDVGIPVAYIDDKYSKSFDAIASYYPYELHFVIRPQKCGIKLSLNNSFNRILVKSFNEDGSSITVVIKPNEPINNYLDLCGDRIEVEGYSSPVPLLTIRYNGGESYIITKESPLILLIGFLLLANAIILRFKKLRRR
ncbi:MAG: hypothetical protein QW775_05970 [Ignisphaera sp.]|uniref:Uncharacterized protein n=1 Tax=Ignisphaera aggregans TaxID=334771 RepID=A0A7C4JJQ5_9CREN